MTAGLFAEIGVTRGRFGLDVTLSMEPGEVVAVLGPNGAGKSTLLAALAGLIPLDTGEIRLGPRVLSRPGHTVAPEQRRIGLMSQDPMLFPHLTAVENVAFGPRAAGVPRGRARAQARDLLASVDVATLADRRPAALSGGQQQRVALARAIAAAPDLLLLDEPLAALDVQTAPEIRQLLRVQLRTGGRSVLIVTHDVLDAVVIADRVVVLADGRLVADGPPGTVLAAPANQFIAALAGVNLVTGPVRDGAVLAPDGRVVAGLAALPLVEGSPAAAVFAPSAVAVHLTDPHGSPRNHWHSRVLAIEPGSATVRLRLAGDPQLVAEITPAALADLDLEPGREVWIAVKATEVALHAR